MKARSAHLLDRAVLAMAAAVELYNKPGLPYRNESFSILAVNGWELLLKARWLRLHSNKVKSLYVYEHRTDSKGRRSARPSIRLTQSRAPQTHGLLYLAGQLHSAGNLVEAVLRNLEGMSEIRDCASHFYHEAPNLDARLYEFGAACVKNFANAVQEWFGRDVTEFGFRLMPLTFLDLPTIVEGSLLNKDERRILAFLDGIDGSNTDPDATYTTSVSVDVRFTRSKSQQAIPVQVTQDPSAIAVTLTEEDIRQRFPWDYKTLTEKCKERYSDFMPNRKYHSIRMALESDKRYGHRRFLDPHNPTGQGKPLYNPSIVAQLDHHYTKRQAST